MEYKNITLQNKEKCLAYFVSEDGIFADGYYAYHSEPKYYNIEIERGKMLKYLKDVVSISPCKKKNLKNIFNNIKALLLNLTNKYNDISQNIYNYIEKAREHELKAIKEINLDHPLFIDLNGENMLLLHSDYGFVMKTLQ